jgi:ligand-binding sensor domain-containing protein
MARYILSIIAAFFITLSSFAQGGLPSRFNVSYLNMAAGMPNNFADDIFQDSYGFVWISTHGGGLVRYDGFNFVNFGLGSNAISLRSNSCRNVYEDHFRRLWIAFEEGPQVLDLNTMQPIVPPCENEKVEAQLRKALKNSSSNRMYCDAKGNIWMISINLLTRFGFNEKGEVNSVLSVAYPFNAPDLGLCDVYRRGTVVLCNNGVVSEFSVKNNKLVARDISSMFPPLDGRYAGAIISYHGKIWIATNRGLFNSAKQQYHCSATDHSLQHEVVTSLAISPDDKLLVGTLCGVDIINDKTGEIEHWNCNSAVNPLSSNFVNSLFAKNGQIWVATETGGVTKLAPRQLQLEFYRHDASNPGSLSPNAVNAMYAAPDGTLWVGTVEGGLNSLAPGGKNFTHYTTANSGLPHNSVSTLAADNRGNLWIGTWGTGFAVMNLKQPGKITPLVVDAQHQHFLNFAGALAYDPINDGMWLGTNDGLFFYDLKHQQITEPFKGCLNVRGCIGALITKDGKLLMGCVQGMVEVNLKSHTIGNLGDIAIGNILYYQLLGNIQAIVADKLRRRQSALRIEFLAQDASVHTQGIGKFLDTELRIIVILLHHFHNRFHERFGMFSYFLSIRLEGFLLTFLIALLVFQNHLDAALQLAWVITLLQGSLNRPIQSLHLSLTHLIQLADISILRQSNDEDNHQRDKPPAFPEVRRHLHGY